MKIDRYKLKVTSYSTELDKPLDRDLRCFVLTEMEVYDVSHPDNQDGSYDEVFKAKAVGSTEVKQEGRKAVKGKSKRSQSQKLRQAIWCEMPSDEYYEIIMSKIITNIKDVIDYLKDK